MSLNAEKKTLPKISMRKTKKRVAAATKLQAAVRGRRTRVEQEKKSKAVAKLQALARGKRGRKRAAKLKAKKKRTTKIKSRKAYKSYLSSHTIQNNEEVMGLAGFSLIDEFHPLERPLHSCHRKRLQR